MTAGDIIRLLMRARWRRKFVLPTYAPKGWWECDVFELTPAGYFREYEVKMTRADFLADRRKGTRGWRMEGGRPDCRHRFAARVCLLCGAGYRPVLTESKHGLIEARDPRGPSRFWYVAPEGLLTAADLPAWAGLIEVAARQVGAVPRLWERETRAAPVLHREKLAGGAVTHARGICYWRMHDLIRREHRRTRGAAAS